MSLTYHPFANVPEIEELGKELYKNVPDGERAISALSGAGLIASAWTRHGVARWALLAAGLALVSRGWVGHCPLYQQMALDRRHSQDN